MFDHPLQQVEAVKQLLSLKQGNNFVSKHALKYRITAAWTGWDKAKLQGNFLHSLSDHIKDILATTDKPQSLDDLINLATYIDNHFHQMRREVDYNSQHHNASRFQPTSNCHAAAPRAKNLMQVGWIHLTPDGRQRRIVSRACIYCGKKGHFIACCQLWGNKSTHQ